MKSKRWLYAILITVTIPAGIGTRSYGFALPEPVSTYGGDVLAATCIFFGVRFVKTKSSLTQNAIIAYLISIAIEISQLYQAPWIQKVRHTYPMGILLGYGFLWSDWVCYAVGVLLGVLIGYAFEQFLLGRAAKK